MLFIGHNLFNIGHCTFFTPLCKHIEKKNHHHTSYVAVMLSTSGWTPHNQLSSNPDSHWLQLLTMYDADPVLNVPEVWNSCWSICYGDSYCFVLLIVVWSEFSLGAVTYTANHIRNVPDVTLAGCHLLRCVPESVAAFVIWRTELCAHLLPKVADLSRHPISLFHESYLLSTPDQTTTMLSSSQQQSNWKLMAIETETTRVNSRSLTPAVTASYRNDSISY